MTDITKLAAAHAASTQGEWIAEGGTLRCADGPAKWGLPNGKQEAANIAFIALAHNTLPALLAQLQAQTEGLASVSRKVAAVQEAMALGDFAAARIILAQMKGQP